MPCKNTVNASNFLDEITSQILITKAQKQGYPLLSHLMSRVWLGGGHLPASAKA